MVGGGNVFFILQKNKMKGRLALYGSVAAKKAREFLNFILDFAPTWKKYRAIWSLNHKIKTFQIHLTSLFIFLFQLNHSCLPNPCLLQLNSWKQLNLCSFHKYLTETYTQLLWLPTSHSVWNSDENEINVNSTFLDFG